MRKKKDKAITEITVFTEILGGHRTIWCELIQQRCAENNLEFSLIHGFNFKHKPLTDGKLLSIISGSLMKVKQLRQLGSDKQNSLFVFIDGDKLLPFLLFTRLFAKIIIVRPFLEETSIRGVLRYSSKIFLVQLLRLLKFDVGVLTIPSHSPRFLRDVAVNDLPLNLMRPTSPDPDLNEEEEYPSVPPNYILLPGFIDQRKNPFLAISVFEEFRTKIEIDIKLVFAGKMNPEIKSLILSKNLEHVVLIDRFFEQNIYIRLIQDAFAILLPYSNRGSSGIALEATTLGVPVVLVGGKKWKSASKSSSGNLAYVPGKHGDILQALLEVYHNNVSRTPVEIRNLGVPSFLDYVFSGK